MSFVRGEVTIIKQVIVIPFLRPFKNTLVIHFWDFYADLQNFAPYSSGILNQPCRRPNTPQRFSADIMNIAIPPKDSL